MWVCEQYEYVYQVPTTNQPMYKWDITISITNYQLQPKKGPIGYIIVYIHMYILYIICRYTIVYIVCSICICICFHHSSLALGFWTCRRSNQPASPSAMNRIWFKKIRQAPEGVERRIQLGLVSIRDRPEVAAAVEVLSAVDPIEVAACSSSHLCLWRDSHSDSTCP